MADVKKKKEKKENKHWFKDFKNELKKVTWLTPKQLVKSTAAVITIILIVAFIVFVLDFVFEALNNQGVERLKGFVQNDQAVVQAEENTTNELLDQAIENAIVENTTVEAE